MGKQISFVKVFKLKNVSILVFMRMAFKVAFCPKIKGEKINNLLHKVCFWTLLFPALLHFQAHSFMIIKPTLV